MRRIDENLDEIIIYMPSQVETRVIVYIRWKHQTLLKTLIAILFDKCFVSHCLAANKNERCEGRAILRVNDVLRVLNIALVKICMRSLRSPMRLHRESIKKLTDCHDDSLCKNVGSQLMRRESAIQNKSYIDKHLYYINIIVFENISKIIRYYL